MDIEKKKKNTPENVILSWIFKTLSYVLTKTKIAMCILSRRVLCNDVV